MAIGGHKTRAVFERLNIISGRDLEDAAWKLESYLACQNGDKRGQSSVGGRLSQSIEGIGSPSCTICEPFDSSALEIPQVFGGTRVLTECAKTLLRVFELA